MSALTSCWPWTTPLLDPQHLLIIYLFGAGVAGQVARVDIHWVMHDLGLHCSSNLLFRVAARPQ